jgi:hypothetical protein
VSHYWTATCHSFQPASPLYRTDEIVIHYSFGVVRVRGERLSPIFTMIRSQELGSINCAVDKIAKPDEPHIRDILFENAETLMT